MDWILHAQKPASTQSVRYLQRLQDYWPSFNLTALDYCHRILKQPSSLSP